jgi:hypothetical protein
MIHLLPFFVNLNKKKNWYASFAPLHSPVHPLCENDPHIIFYFTLPHTPWSLQKVKKNLIIPTCPIGDPMVQDSFEGISPP